MECLTYKYEIQDVGTFKESSKFGFNEMSFFDFIHFIYFRTNNISQCIILELCNLQESRILINVR